MGGFDPKVFDPQVFDGDEPPPVEPPPTYQVEIVTIKRYPKRVVVRTRLGDGPWSEEKVMREGEVISL